MDSWMEGANKQELRDSPLYSRECFPDRVRSFEEFEFPKDLDMDMCNSSPEIGLSVHKTWR